jgi:hypothetical protein
MKRKLPTEHVFRNGSGEEPERRRKMRWSKSGQKRGQPVKAAHSIVLTIESVADYDSGDWIRTSDLGVMNPIQAS